MYSDKYYCFWINWKGIRWYLRVVSLLDFNTCQLSTDNFLVASGYGNTGNYIPNSKFILISGGMNDQSGYWYILPASLMSNGLNGQ